jgi:type IV secretion system protein VirD4
MRNLALASSFFVTLGSLCAATQWLASVFDHQAALGPAIVVGEYRLYPPWSVLTWSARWGETYPRPFLIAQLIVLGSFVGAIVIVAIAFKRARNIPAFGEGQWGGFAEAMSLGLFARSGVVLGKLDDEILCFDGPEHQLLIGASRSGKGRGHVVPTLLAWAHSAVVLDVKGELADGDPRHGFVGARGFREKLGVALRFAPTLVDSVRLNPLFEVRRGVNETRDVQNIVEILVDPAGDGRHQDFWDRSAKQILVGVILHVLYAEPLARKNLAVVREKLRDLDATAQAMKSVYHRFSPRTGAPEVHPEVLHAAESYLAGEERVQSGIKATAESFFGIFADELVAQKTASSDFRIGELMCHERPVTLFLQPPPSDALRLTPLMRLVINQIARSLMEDQNADSLGRPKRHRLLLLLDEFPMLGRMPFFEAMMGAMAGYGLKALLVCQSLNHLSKAYGRDNVILDNCHIVTAFAASDVETAEKIAAMAGEVWELRETQTQFRPKPLLGWGEGSTTVREERRPLLTSAQVRALPSHEQLVFVAGAKPLRTKKLRFDHEPIFFDRLIPPASASPAKLLATHDWMDVRPIGFAPKSAASKPQSKRPSAEAAQTDLFGDAPSKTEISISEQALAGFRGPNGEVLPPPPTQIVSASDAPRRSKGI